MTYLRQIDAIENTLMPALMLIALEHHRKDDPTALTDVYNSIQGDITTFLKNNRQFYKAINAVSNRAFKYFYKEKFESTRKCFMTIKAAAESLEQNEIIYLFNGTKEAFKQIDDAMNCKTSLKKNKLTKEDIVKMRKSAEKHATKLIAKLQKDGYY